MSSPDFQKALSSPVGGNDPAGVAELHVVEWSAEQKALGVRSLSDAVTQTLKAYVEGKPTSFYPVGLFASPMEASAACERLQRIRNAREGMEQLEEQDCEGNEN